MPQWENWSANRSHYRINMSLQSSKGSFYNSIHHNEGQQTSLLFLLNMGVSSGGVFHNPAQQPICRIWVISNSIPLSALILLGRVDLDIHLGREWRVYWTLRWREMRGRGGKKLPSSHRHEKARRLFFFSNDSRTFPLSEWSAQRWNRSSFRELILVEGWWIWSSRFRKHELRPNQNQPLSLTRCV